ncbi:DUF3011 domain-containing protein [Nostoc sp. FACHB-110]|uniref:DUF3011 domain-containing protein n=1 Tax=Nostoc sp. FACHB-110 TaxID=2692834 RepID=UPI00168985DC|nr:DUF3011 domain-containing protein [Nostoc sp. FACHB-110]MBD2435577.1 DUF3011 domain-containing protein [Nostoc sp. FACHB-110]
MVVRLPFIAATFMVASISIGTLLSTAPPAAAQQVITCESQNNRRNTCRVPTAGTIRFVRQLSDASCRGNWGSSRNRVWVRNGCRAQFSVRNSRYDIHRGNNRDFRPNRDRRYNR